MNTEDAEAIFRCTFQQEMIQNVNLPALVPLLNRHGLLTKPEQEQLLNELFTSDKRIMQLTDILSSKGPGCVSKVLDCLRQEKKHPGHAHLLQIIELHIQCAHQIHGGEKATIGESEVLECSFTSRGSSVPYHAMITSLSRQLEALGVSMTQIKTAAQQVLPAADTSTLNSCPISDFASLHSYLSDRQVCSPIEIDIILRLLCELGRHELKEQVLDYAESVKENSIIASTYTLSSPTMEDCFLIYICYKTLVALKVESIWDKKQCLCELFDIERHRFWFVGYEENRTAVTRVVWQFPLAFFDFCIQKIQQCYTQLPQDITSIHCLHLNEQHTLFCANAGPIVDISAVMKCPRTKRQAPPLQSGDAPPPAKRQPPILGDSPIPERGDDSNTKHSENSQEDYEPRFMDNPDEHDCRGLLNKCQPDFVRYLDLPSLIPHLNAHLLLTHHQDEFLRNERHTRHDRILKLLEYIDGKGPDGHRKFLQALREERTHMGHKELYKCLTKTDPRFLSPQDTLIERLKEVYSSDEWYKNASGSNPNNLEYIRLALIKKAKLSKNASERSTCRFLKDSLLGNVDDIENTKEALKEAKEIFNYGRDSKRKKVLIEGKPGIGKTMLALHISAEWARGEMLQEYDCVLVVPLRRFQRKVQTSKRTPEYQLQKELDTIDLVKVYLGGERGFQASEGLNRSGGENTLFILEGWDELPPELREEGSFFFRIVSGQLFPKASVLVTSRPTVSSDLYDFMGERRIEVIGFSRKQIRQYIEKNIPLKKEMVLKHLQKFPNVERLAHIPMTLCTICNLVTAGYMESLPSTLTELYDTYVRDILYNGFKKHPNPEFKHIRGISNLCNLPGESQQVLVSLTKLALQGLLKKKFVFVADDLTEVGLQPEGNFDAYGLLSTFPCYVGAGYDLFYQFRHLTIQEFLAAKGIVNLDHSQQMSLLDKYRLQKEFQVVWKFLSGITKLEDDKLRDAIVFKTRRGNNHEELFLLHCVYEAHDPQLCSTAAGYLEHKLSLDNCTLNSTDCLCAAYIVAQSGGEWELNLRGCHMGGEGLETLRWHLVEYRNPNAPPAVLANLDIGSNSLHLHPCESSEPSEPLELHGTDVLSALIKDSIPIIEINVDSTKFDDNGTAILAEALCHNTTIQSIWIGTCGITANGAEYLASILLTNTTVKSLFLRWNNLGDNGVKHIASALTKNNTLTQLSIGNNNMGTGGVSHLCNMLKINQTLEVLRIPGSHVGPAECRLLSETFPHNKTLQLIDMSKNEIGDDGLTIIVEGLKVNHHCGLRRLGLLGCDITDRGVEKVCELITCDYLKSLQLGYNPKITDAGAECLARALQFNTSVKAVRLENTKVKEKGKTFLDRICDSREDLDITYEPNVHLSRRKHKGKHRSQPMTDYGSAF